MQTKIGLEDRGVVEIGGPDAAKFLHNILTNDVLSLEPGAARFAAFLSPQGKLLFDFLIFAQDAPEGRAYLLDTPKALVPDLLRRLGMYKLRAAITLRDRSDELTCFAALGDEAPGGDAVALARDPRASGLGWRGIAASSAELSTDRSAYERARIEAGVPEGGRDFAYGDAYPHDVNMDWLNGIDFKKGCFIGQEVVSRMKHRGTARKRILRFEAAGAPAPGGAPIHAGETLLGETGSVMGNAGLAMIRTDKLAAARDAGLPALVGDTTIDCVIPESQTP